MFLGAALAVALAALNTGNNLLYLVFATQLAMITLSGVLSELSVQQLRPRRRIVGRVFVGRPASGLWYLRNPRARLPSLALTIAEARSPDATLRGVAKAQVPVLVAQDSQEVRAQWIFVERGIHRLAGVRIATTWPFGIFEKYYEVATPLDVLVHPEPLPAAARSAVALGPDDEGPASRGAGDGTFLGLRDHRDGEDPRRIHWRTSARLGRAVAIERADHRGGDVRVLVPTPQGADRDARAAAFEQALRRATGEVLNAEKAQRDVELLLPGCRPLRAQAHELGRALAALALAEIPPPPIAEA